MLLLALWHKLGYKILEKVNAEVIMLEPLAEGWKPATNETWILSVATVVHVVVEGRKSLMPTEHASQRECIFWRCWYFEGRTSDGRFGFVLHWNILRLEVIKLWEEKWKWSFLVKAGTRAQESHGNEIHGEESDNEGHYTVTFPQSIMLFPWKSHSPSTKSVFTR